MSLRVESMNKASIAAVDIMAHAQPVSVQIKSPEFPTPEAAIASDTFKIVATVTHPRYIENVTSTHKKIKQLSRGVRHSPARK